MNFIQRNLAATEHNEESKSDAIMSKNQILGRAVLGTPSLPIIRPNRQSSSSASNTKTPSTARRKSMLGSAAMKSEGSRLTVNSRVVVAVYKGRGQARGIVGIAAMDIKKAALVLFQISDTRAYTNTLRQINIIRPVEVLIPSSFVVSTTPTRFETLLKDQFPNVTVHTVSHYAFRRSRGLSYVKRYSAPEFQSVTLVIREKFYALASASALIKYLQKVQHIMYPLRSMKIEYQEPADTAVIDVDSVTVKHLDPQSETRHTSYRENPSYFLGSCSTETHQSTAHRTPWPTNSIAQDCDCDRYQSHNVNRSTSGYQSNVFPNQQPSRTTEQYSNTNDMARPGTSGFQSEPQRLSKSESTTCQDGFKSRVPRHKRTYQSNVCPNQQLRRTTVHHSNTDDMACPSTSGNKSESQRMPKGQSTTCQDGSKSKVKTQKHTYHFNVCPNQQTCRSTIQHTNTDDITYQSTSRIKAKRQRKPKENATATDSFRVKKQKHAFESNEKKTGTPFVFNPVLPPRKSVTLDFSAKNDPSSFIKYANTNTESVLPNPAFKNPVNNLETLPCTSKSQTTQTDKDICTEPFVPKRIGRSKSKKSQSNNFLHRLFELFVANYEEERKKIEGVLKGDGDEEYLRTFEQDHLKQDPTPAPVQQLPRGDELSTIMNPKKNSKRESRSHKGTKNKIPLERYKQPGKTRTKRVSSPLFKHEKKTAKQQLTEPEAYVPPRRETNNQPEPSTLNQQEQNRKRKPKTKKEPNVKLEKELSKRKSKVTGKPREMANMMQTDDKCSEDLAYNQLETHVMAPLRAKRQMDIDQFLDDVRRLHIKIEAMTA